MAAEAAIRKWKCLVLRKREERLQLQDGAEMKEKAKQSRGLHTANIIYKKKAPQEDQMSDFSSLKRFDWNKIIQDENGYEDEDEESKRGTFLNQLNNNQAFGNTIQSGFLHDNGHQTNYPTQSMKSSLTKNLGISNCTNNQLMSSGNEPIINSRQKRQLKYGSRQKTTVERNTKYNSNAKLYNYKIDNQSPGASIDEQIVRKKSSSNMLTGQITIQGNVVNSSKFNNQRQFTLKGRVLNSHYSEEGSDSLSRESETINNIQNEQSGRDNSPDINEKGNNNQLTYPISKQPPRESIVDEEELGSQQDP